MAHKEDVYVDEAGRFIIGEHTCPENLTGWYGDCTDEWCIERNHEWFTVTRIVPDGSGEDMNQSFDYESDAIDWATDHFDRVAS